jgi:hypothetical protein
MKIEIDIQEILVLEDSHGGDKICITTNMPPTYWPWNEPCVLRIDCASKTGVNYVRENFGVEPDRLVYMHPTEERKEKNN